MQKFYGSQGGAPGGGAPGGFPGAGGDAGAKTDDGPSVESAPLLHFSRTQLTIQGGRLIISPGRCVLVKIEVTGYIMYHASIKQA